MVDSWLDVLPLDHPLSEPNCLAVAPSDRQTHEAVQRAVMSCRVEHFLCMWPPSKHVVPHVKLLQPWPSPPDAGFVCMLHFSDNFMPGHFEPVVFLHRTGQDGRMPYHRWPLTPQPGSIAVGRYLFQSPHQSGVFGHLFYELTAQQVKDGAVKLNKRWSNSMASKLEIAMQLGEQDHGWEDTTLRTLEIVPAPQPVSGRVDKQGIVHDVGCTRLHKGAHVLAVAWPPGHTTVG